MTSNPDLQETKVSPTLERINVPSAPQAAAEALRNGIIRGDFKPGERLIEQKVARLLGIGQPTLREAFKELEFQGFVRKGPKRGTYVTKLTNKDFRMIQEVRMALEALAIEKAALQLTLQAELELREFVRSMGAAAEAFDLESFHRMHMDFHRKVWALAGNVYLANALELVAFRLFAFVLIQRRESGSEFLNAAQQHQDILAGLLSGDPVKAREAFVVSNLKSWGEHHQGKLDEKLLRVYSSAPNTT